MKYDCVVTVTSRDPATRAAIAEAEIVVKALDGLRPLRRTETDSTIEIVFGRA